MDVVKKFLFAIILLVVVGLAWVGLSFYLDSQKKSVTGNVEAYTKQIAGKFNMEELDKVVERSKKSLAIQPKEFTSLLGKD